MTKVAYVEWSDGLGADQESWADTALSVKDSGADILVTNEMPFGAWRPTNRRFDIREASAWVREHEEALGALSDLNVPAIISSRPVLIDDRLANEAFSLVGGDYKVLHHKHFFPEEPGWYEASWFTCAEQGFDVHDILGVKVGVLLCTELMFSEKARHYGRQGADLIVAPRASGMNLHYWQAACAMASVAAGAWVISSNRVGSAGPGTPQFGGRGMAYAPAGVPLGQTSAEVPLMVTNIDVQLSKDSKREYPCYLEYL